MGLAIVLLRSLIDHSMPEAITLSRTSLTAAGVDGTWTDMVFDRMTPSALMNVSWPGTLRSWAEAGKYREQLRTAFPDWKPE